MKFTLSRHFKLRSRPINCDILLHKIVHMYVVFALFRYLLSLQHSQGSKLAVVQWPEATK